MREVHLLLPAGYDDADRASGGNTYDRRLVAGLMGLGRRVVVHSVEGAWPAPSRSALAVLDQGVARALAEVPDGAMVVVDGLLTSASVPLIRAAERLRLVVLAHMAEPPGAPDPEVARRCALVLATSRWTAQEVVRQLEVAVERVAVAEPGVEVGALAPGTATGGGLLCVGAVTPGKGQQLLVEALAGLTDRAWTCSLVGALDRDDAYVAQVRSSVREGGLDGRVRLIGQLGTGALSEAYGAADVLVHPSRHEGYGLVVTEALARGLPVIASEIGGIPEALGRTGDGAVPGLLVPPGSVPALRAALRSWLDSPGRRAGLRAQAMSRRVSLPTWEDTARAASAALARVGGPSGRPRDPERSRG